MKTLLESAKALLINRANDLYDMRKDELDFDALSYRNHYSNLGELIFQIDAYESLGDLIKDIEDEFSEELEFLDDKTSAEILKRLKDLEIIYPNSPALKKFKKKYLNSNNKSVQTAKEKAKVKKK